MTATKTFTNYKSEVLSFYNTNERQLGLIEPGRIRGFDSLFVTTPGLIFNLSHTLTGIVKVGIDGVTESSPTGVLYTRQGTIAHFESNVESLSLPSNELESQQVIHVVYFQHKYQQTTSPSLGSVNVLTGIPGAGEPSLPSPTEQIKIGTITLEAGATQVLPENWAPARVLGTGGEEFATTEELGNLDAEVVKLLGTQVISGDKTFQGQLLVVDPNNSNNIIDVGARLANKYTVFYDGGSPTFSNDYLSILYSESTSPSSQLNGIISLRAETPTGNSTIRFAFSILGNPQSSEYFIDVLEYSQGNPSLPFKPEDIIAYQFDPGTGAQTRLMVKIPANIPANYYLDVTHWDGGDEYTLAPTVETITFIGSSTNYLAVNRSYPLELSKTVNLVQEAYAFWVPDTSPNDTESTAKTRGYLLKLVDGVKNYEIFANSANGDEVESLLAGIDGSQVQDLYKGFSITLKVNGLWNNGSNSRGDSLGTNRVLGVWFIAEDFQTGVPQYVTGYNSSNTRNSKIFSMQNVSAAANPYREVFSAIAESFEILDYAGKALGGPPNASFRVSGSFLKTATVGLGTTLPVDPDQQGLTRAYDPYIYLTIQWDGNSWQEIHRTMGSPVYY